MLFHPGSLGTIQNLAWWNHSPVCKATAIRDFAGKIADRSTISNAIGGIVKFGVFAGKSAGTLAHGREIRTSPYKVDLGIRLGSPACLGLGSCSNFKKVR